MTATSYPFGKVRNTDLSAYGYVEEEYFVSGKANVYASNAAGTIAEVKTKDAPYTTRIIVIKPSDPAKFSGKVVVDVVNTSNPWDFNKLWAVMHNFVLENGWGHVGITSKPGAVAALKTFDAARYASLLGKPAASE